eukprot:Clim_evm3s243 gene=Clim_evmTU3s243
MKVKLNIRAVHALLVLATVSHAARVPMSRRETSDPSCPFILYTANGSLWDYNGDHGVLEEFDYVMDGYMDMRPLSKFIVEQGTDFEAYMASRMGNFQVLYTDGVTIDPWNSVLWKLNALTGPVLLTGFEVDRTDENGDTWDAWWNALQDLIPTELAAYCDPNAQDKSFKPWAVAFPLYIIEFVQDTITREWSQIGGGSFANAGFLGQDTEILQPRIWDAVVTSSNAAQPKSFLHANSNTQCDNFTYSYSKTVQQELTTSLSTTVTTSTQVAASYEESFKAGLDFKIISDSVQETVKASFQDTFTASTTDGATNSTSVSLQSTLSSSAIAVPQNVVNLTVWTEQYEATIGMTGDLDFDAENTGFQVWIQGNGVPDISDFPNTPDIAGKIFNGDLATPAKIENVARLAMELIGAEWSDTFLNSMVSTSIDGTVNTLSGNDTIVETWACEFNDITVNGDVIICDQLFATQFPPQNTRCPGLDRRETQETSDSFHDKNMLSLLGLRADCFGVEPVEGHQNRWRVHSHGDCTNISSASDDSGQTQEPTSSSL